MSATAQVPAGLPAAAADGFGRRRTMWRTVIGSGSGRAGLVIGLIMLLIVVFGPMLAPHPPAEIGFLPNQGPSSGHPLGTDNLGRDVLSRFLNGGRSVVVVPLVAVTLAFVVGAGLGMFAGYRRGLADEVIRRLFDIVLALPSLLVVLVIIAGFGPSTLVVILSVALVYAPRTGRLLRSATLSVVNSDYVARAQARGERTPWILVSELLPNIAGPAIAEYALRLTWALIFVATLSFLGLGAQPPSSNWGLMVAQGQPYLSINAAATIAPALGIALLSISLNLVADAMTRHWEPASSKQGIVV